MYLFSGPLLSLQNFALQMCTTPCVSAVPMHLLNLNEAQ
jgi:hypothetical protein